MGLTHLTQTQIGTLLDLAASQPRDHALLAMSAYTALRISDILIMEVADVLDEQGRVKQRMVRKQKKTGKRIEITLPEPLRQSLRVYLDGRKKPDRAEPLFVNRDRNGFRNRQRGTGRLTRWGAHAVFKKYLAQVLGVSREELRGLSTHALRRSLAMMIYNEYGLRAAQELLGHSSIGSTGVYLDKVIAAAQADTFRNALDFSKQPKAKRARAK